ncbi:MAG TPA: FCD domain-containing protein [Stellaceae bacterium]|nr:FCD domain-containing protein [Stellaceae bacterium]
MPPGEQEHGLPLKRATLASSIYEKLREEIVKADLLPGEKLRIETLRQRFGVGGSPVREALNRLSAEGLVAQQDQKGFRVASVSRDELNELVRTRCWVNEIVVREAILRGDTAWEEAIVLAFHRLSRAQPRLPDSTHLVDPVWDQLHRAFHSALIAACGSRWMVNFAEMLFDCAERYRHLSMARRQVPRDVLGEHRAIMEAVINRQTETAITLLNDHIHRTTESLELSKLAEGAPQRLSRGAAVEAKGPQAG